MSDIFKYTGVGEAFIVGEKCKQLKPFTSSYNWEFPNPPEKSIFSKVNYENSIIGKRTLSAVLSPYDVPNEAFWTEISSDGLLNFYANYYSVDGIEYIIVRITGVYKKCNYSSQEIDYYIPTTTSANNLKLIKKKSRSSEEFHKLLESDPDLNKLYLKLKAKIDK
jgi:hypothetical protein